MAEELPVPIDHPFPVVLRLLAGPSYATVQVQGAHGPREAPVHLGACEAIDDYGLLMARSAEHLLPTGVPLRACWGGSGLGAFHELPSLEIYLGQRDQTVGEYWVSQGWAVPRSSLLAANPRRDAYLHALTSARAHGVGVWGEVDAELRASLDPTLAAATAPPPHPAAAVVETAILVVLLLAAAIGMRDRARVAAAAATAAASPASTTAPAPTRGWWRLATGGLRWYWRGLLPPRASAANAPVPTTPPRPPGGTP